MKSLLLVGCGGHSRSLIDLIESTGEWSIAGLVGLPEQVGRLVLGYPVIGSDTDFPALRAENNSVVLAIGQLPDSTQRERLVAVLEKHRFRFPIVISPHSVVSRYAQLAAGTTVGHGAIVNAGAVVGRHCILNSRLLNEHDVQIGDYCHVSTGALINGGVRIGAGSFIGSGAVIREGIVLPPSTVVGAGKLVMGWPVRD